MPRWELHAGGAAQTPGRAPRCRGCACRPRDGAARGGPVFPAGPRPPSRAELTEAAPAQRAVAAVQHSAELAQQRRRQVKQERVHRERPTGPAVVRRRRPGHDSVAGDQGPGGGGMRTPGFCTPAKCCCTNAEILLTRQRPRQQNTPSPSPGMGGPHMTHSASLPRCPRGPTAWRRGLPASADRFSLA